MLCSRCKKRQGVVYLSAGPLGQEGSQDAWLCLTCAYELNIPQIKGFLSNMGITGKEQLEAAEERMDRMIKDNPQLSAMMNSNMANLSPDDLSQMMETMSSMNPEMMEAFSDMSIFDEDDEDMFIGDEDPELDDDDAYEDPDDDSEQEPEIHIFQNGEEITEKGNEKAQLGNIFALAAQQDDEEIDDADGDDADDDDDTDSAKPGWPAAFEKLFGSNFQPGGAAYADDSGDKKEKKRQEKQKGSQA